MGNRFEVVGPMSGSACMGASKEYPCIKYIAPHHKNDRRGSNQVLTYDLPPGELTQLMLIHIQEGHEAMTTGSGRPAQPYLFMTSAGHAFNNCTFSQWWFGFYCTHGGPKPHFPPSKGRTLFVEHFISSTGQQPHEWEGPALAMGNSVKQWREFYAPRMKGRLAQEAVQKHQAWRESLVAGHPGSSQPHPPHHHQAAEHTYCTHTTQAFADANGVDDELKPFEHAPASPTVAPSSPPVFSHSHKPQPFSAAPLFQQHHHQAPASPSSPLGVAGAASSLDAALDASTSRLKRPKREHVGEEEHYDGGGACCALACEPDAAAPMHNKRVKAEHGSAPQHLAPLDLHQQQDQLAEGGGRYGWADGWGAGEGEEEEEVDQGEEGQEGHLGAMEAATPYGDAEGGVEGEDGDEVEIIADFAKQPAELIDLVTESGGEEDWEGDA